MVWEFFYFIFFFYEYLRRRRSMSCRLASESIHYKYTLTTFTGFVGAKRWVHDNYYKHEVLVFNRVNTFVAYRWHFNWMAFVLAVLLRVYFSLMVLTTECTLYEEKPRVVKLWCAPERAKTPQWLLSQSTYSVQRNHLIGKLIQRSAVGQNIRISL